MNEGKPFMGRGCKPQSQNTIKPTLNEFQTEIFRSKIRQDLLESPILVELEQRLLILLLCLFGR